MLRRVAWAISDKLVGYSLTFTWKVLGVLKTMIANLPLEREGGKKGGGGGEEFPGG